MNVYVALRDEPNTKGANESFVVGAFSTEDKAQDACQYDADSDAETSGQARAALIWVDAEARLPDGSKYAIVLVDLDVPPG